MTWYILKPEDSVAIYTPSLKVANAKSLHWTKSFGPNEITYFWFQKPHHLEYRTSLQVKLYCSFAFDDFPFDHHICDFNLGGHTLSKLNLIVAPPQISFTQNRYVLLKINFLRFLLLRFIVQGDQLQWKIKCSFPQCFSKIHFNH